MNFFDLIAIIVGVWGLVQITAIVASRKRQG